MGNRPHFPPRPIVRDLAPALLDPEPADPTSDSSAESSFRRLAIATVVFLCGLAAWRALQFGAPYGGDWAQYMSHAKALVEGRPYDDIGYIFSPYSWLIGPPVYPPGLPILLSPSIALFGDSTVVPRILMHVLLGAFLSAVYLYFARNGDRLVALGTVALLGTSFLLRDTANIVGSDLGMCAFAWIALTTAEASDDWSLRRTAALGLLGILAISFRLAAAPLVPALVLWAVLRYRSVGLRPWIVAALWGMVLIAVIGAFGPGDQASEAAAHRLVGPGGVEQSDFSRGVSRTLDRLATYRFAVSEAFLYPFPFKPANQLYHVAALLLAIGGLWGWLRREWTRLGVVFGAGTCAMLLVLPVWASRYAWILTPFVCFGLVRALSVGFARLPRLTVLRAGSLACVCALGLAGLATLDLAQARDRGLSNDAADWRALGSALGSGPDATVLRAASNRPRMLAWYTGIPATGLPNVDLNVFLEEARRLDLSIVMVSTLRSREPEFQRWLDWRRDHPSAFIPLYQVGGLEVYSINTTDAADPGPDN